MKPDVMDFMELQESGPIPISGRFQKACAAISQSDKTAQNGGAHLFCLNISHGQRLVEVVCPSDNQVLWQEGLQKWWLTFRTALGTHWQAMHFALPCVCHMVTYGHTMNCPLLLTSLNITTVIASGWSSREHPCRACCTNPVVRWPHGHLKTF